MVDTVRCMKARLLTTDMLNQLDIKFEWDVHNHTGTWRNEYMQAWKEVKKELKKRKREDAAHKRYLEERTNNQTKDSSFINLVIHPTKTLDMMDFVHQVCGIRRTP